MSRPSNSTWPEVAARSPVRQLKKVDLPAPFGPIRPRISPCSSVTEAPSTARKLPKALVISRASRSMAGSRGRRSRRFARLGAALEDAVSERQQPAGLEAGDQHDDRTVNHEGEPRALPAELAIGDFFQRHEDRRAHQRTEYKTGAAERSHDQYLHRDQDAEPGLRIDKAEHHGIERAGNRGQARAQHVGMELGARGRRTKRTRRALGIPDGTQVEAHAAVGHPP